jgi:hypothetical protein
MNRLSSVFPIDLSISDSYESEDLNNVETLIHVLKCSFGALAHSQSPRLVFKRKGDAAFECWVQGNEGFYLKPQISIPTTGEGLDPYRTVACAIMIRLRRWNEENKEETTLEIPIHF